MARRSDDPQDQQPARPIAHGLIHLGHPEAHIPGYEIPDITAPPISRTAILIGFMIAAIVALGGFLLEHFGHGVADATVSIAWVAPFVLLLGSIAIMPFVARHWWERNYARVSLALSAIVAMYYIAFVAHGRGNLARSLAEYISFIFLLGSLFIVSGGIFIRVRARATPTANVILLLIGAVIANIFGTTGAAMLLIRPYLQMNRRHVRPYHVVFFIFIVANVGGSLTPIGDPPLFLGYLMGVPFFWVLEHCWPIWMLAVGALLAVFFAIDFRASRKTSRGKYDGDDFGPVVSFYGVVNLLFIALILISIVLHNQINAWMHARIGFEGPWRELLMAMATAASLWFTSHRIHAENHFNYAPIKEVALLFAGIFVTMLPALNYLASATREGKSPLHTPGQYFFTAGGLSSVLDNAPTYLTFLKAELSSLDDEVAARAVAIVERPGAEVTSADLVGLDQPQQSDLRQTIAALLRYHGERVSTGALDESEIRVGMLIGDDRLNTFLVAISMGAVLFGAATYIGNGPNFMVKSVAENSGAPTPSFFAYILYFTLPILLPVLILAWLIFLR